MVRYRYPILMGLLAVLQVSLLYWVARTDSISTVSDSSGIAIALIQLVALFAPALALFMQALLRYSADKGDRPWKESGVGGMVANEFRLFVLFSGFFSSLLLINGLLILLISLDLPRAIDIAVTPIAVGLLLVPVMLGLTFGIEFNDRYL